MRSILFIILFIFISGCDKISHLQTNSPNININKPNYIDKNLSVKNDIELFFSKTSGSYSGGIDDKIVKDINLAKKEIYLAMYEFTNRKIEKAIENAYNRGLKVNIVTDDKEYNNKDKNLYDELESKGINVQTDEGLRSGLMHDKILVLDNNISWSGSTNFTYHSFYSNYENAVRVTNFKIVSKYKEEIEELLNKDIKENPYKGNRFELYCSPTDNIEEKLIDLIDDAKKRVYIMAFAFTSKNIKDALIVAKERGIDIKVIFDSTQAKSKYSQYSNLKNYNIAAKLAGSPNHIFHNKVLIIDDIAITGSYNLSYNADHNNCENILIIKDKTITSKYLNYFNKIWNQN